MSPLGFQICQNPEDFIYNCITHTLKFQSSGDINEFLIQVSSTNFQMFLLNTQIIWSGTNLKRNARVQIEISFDCMFSHGKEKSIINEIYFSVSDSIISQRQQMLKSPASQMFLLRKKTSVISFMSPLVFHICQIISPDEFIYNCMAHALHFQSSGDVNELLVHVSSTSFQMCLLNTQIIWLTLMRNAWVQMNFFLSHLFLRDSKEVRWRKKSAFCFSEVVFVKTSSHEPPLVFQKRSQQCLRFAKTLKSAMKSQRSQHELNDFSLNNQNCSPYALYSSVL